MPFKKVTPEKLSSAVTAQIEKLILRGILHPGERLPAERELAERLGVSRPSLREAVAELQAKGLLASKAGSGIYVADVLGNAFSDALIGLFASHDEAVFDYIAFRRDMEGLAAERAARLASDTDLKVIDAIYTKMEKAHTQSDPETEAKLDADFHHGHSGGQPQCDHASHDAVDVSAFAGRRILQPQNHVPTRRPPPNPSGST